MRKARIAQTGRAEPTPVERFDAINRERMRRTHDCLLPRQQIFLEIVALLFHTNHPLLPGYVSQATPAGICDYSPDRTCISAAKRIAKAFAFERRLQTRYALQGIYLMGSPGTVAWSRTSDFDIWLCHVDGIDPAELALLQQKADAIEAWAAELGLEVHFFLFHAGRFKRGETMDMSAESSGSSQFHLLLDEFYRSGLVLAGLKPLWWVVPPDQDQHYEEYIADQIAQRKLNRGEFIDFGGLREIPADEFFGAAVWQLSKSIGSPFKSVQKLLLMEAYAFEYPDIELVSSRYKKAVHAGEDRLNELDPYLQMYRKVEEYLLRHADSTRLEVLRRSFYLKAHDKLSRPPAPSDPLWRRAILEQLVAEWGWQLDILVGLDRHDTWKIEPVLQERRDLIKALSQCYARLSEFARVHAENPRITQTDLNILGRKLYAAFERKPGKVEFVNHGISENLYEDELSLHAIETQGGTAWTLFRGAIGPDAIGGATPIRRDATFIELAAWCHFNRISGPRTWWHLFPGTTALTAAELRSITRYFEEKFPDAAIPPSTADSLGKAPAITRAALLVNIAFDPMQARVRDGDVMTSDNSDAFQFGAQRFNLAHHFELVLATSWQEVFCFRYQGIEGLLRAICEYLRWSPIAERSPPPPLTVASFSAQYANLVERRVARLFEHVGAFFHEDPQLQARNYVLAVGDRFYRIFSAGGRLEIETLDNYQRLLGSLGETTGHYTETRFDVDALKASPLPIIYAANRPNHIQVFIESRGRKTNIYVLDECGTLFTQTCDARSTAHVYAHLWKFFESTRKHLLIATSTHGSEIANLVVEFHELGRNRNGQYEARQFTLANPSADYLPVRVFGDVDSAGGRVYTVYCGNTEFSTAAHGGRVLDAAAAFIRAARRGDETYPVYITDIDLSHAVLAEQGMTTLQTAHLLNQKKRLEFHLTRALQNRSEM